MLKNTSWNIVKNIIKYVFPSLLFVKIIGFNPKKFIKVQKSQISYSIWRLKLIFTKTNELKTYLTIKNISLNKNTTSF